MSELIHAISAMTAPQGGGLSVVAHSMKPAAASPAPERQAPAAVEGPDNLDDAVRALQQQAADAGADLEFSIDQELDRVIVTVRDARDGSVLRQIPADEVLRIARMLRDARAPLVESIA